MSVRSRIIGIKMFKKDETLGYEQSFKAHKDMKAADVSIGYGDGISRVQDKPYALCKGNKCAVVGAIHNKNYKAKDGTTKYYTEIVADTIEFLTPKEDQVARDIANK